MKYIPRDYAEQCITAVFADFERTWSTLAVLATGTGKTRIFLEIARRWLLENAGLRCLIVAHREELISQPAKHWRGDNGEWPTIEMGAIHSEQQEERDLVDSAPRNDRIVIASVPTLNSGRRCPACTAGCVPCEKSGRITTACNCEDGCEDCRSTKKRSAKCRDCRGDGWVSTQDECPLCFEHFTRRMQKFRPEDFGLVIIDEAHHSPADTYTRTIRYFRQGNPGLKLLGVTATADRADEEALGQIYDSVAFTYNLPQPITDGWLTPILQQFLHIEELKLANVRTTAGDLNEVDLETEMLAEEVLHKVVTPLVEIACGLTPGTIDRLVKTNALAELPVLCTKREPTLVHAASVAHAERMAEIINRYLPESAMCIVGTTRKEVRRAALERFGAGDCQFMLSCGVFLEGTDLPTVGIVGMARPTMSRSLYTQMLGRGLRVLPGSIDGASSAPERRELIAASSKPRCLVLDFVGNSGRHKLICAADLLGDALPDELVNGVIRKLAQAGQPVNVLAALAQAQREEEGHRRRESHREAVKRQHQEEDAQRHSAEQRAGIVAGASYSTQGVNPFDVMGMALEREPGYYRDRKPTDGMKETLKKNKVPFTDETTFWGAKMLIDEIIRRHREGLCTFSQADWLVRHGYSPNTSFAECRTIMDGWADNNWNAPTRREARTDMRSEEVLDVAREHGLKVVLRDNRPSIKTANGKTNIEASLFAALKHHRERIVELLRKTIK